MPDEESFASLDALFTTLERPEQDGTLQGTRQQRLRTASTCDLFVSVRKPSMVRELIARFHDEILPSHYEIPNFRSLEVQREKQTENDVTWWRISLRPTHSDFNNIFTSLAEDIAHAVGKLTVEIEAALTFQSRLYLWQQLLQKTGVYGLTEEQQQGLYGELWCLREVVLSVLSVLSTLNSWTGPEATDRDFQFAGAIALEVKTTRSSGIQMLSISSERQLDDTGLAGLYILHLALEKKLGAGQTLPQIVAELRSLFCIDPLVFALFEDKLLRAGYLEIHVQRYQNAGYTLHGIHLYRVQEGFPRIIPQDLLPGVGNVRYALSATACQPFAADLRTFTAQLGALQ